MPSQHHSSRSHQNHPRGHLIATQYGFSQDQQRMTKSQEHYRVQQTGERPGRGVFSQTGVKVHQGYPKINSSQRPPRLPARNFSPEKSSSYHAGTMSSSDFKAEPSVSPISPDSYRSVNHVNGIQYSYPNQFSQHGGRNGALSPDKSAAPNEYVLLNLERRKRQNAMEVDAHNHRHPLSQTLSIRSPEKHNGYLSQPTQHWGPSGESKVPSSPEKNTENRHEPSSIGTGMVGAADDYQSNKTERAHREKIKSASNKYQTLVCPDFFPVGKLKGAPRRRKNPWDLSVSLPLKEATNTQSSAESFPSFYGGKSSKIPTEMLTKDDDPYVEDPQEQYLYRSHRAHDPHNSPNRRPPGRAATLSGPIASQQTLPKQKIHESLRQWMLNPPTKPKTDSLPAPQNARIGK